MHLLSLTNNPCLLSRCFKVSKGLNLVLSRLELTKCVDGKLTSVRAECSNTSGLHLLKLDWARLNVTAQAESWNLVEN